MDYSRILIIKPSSLGDIVHALPAAAALRRLYPVAALTWLVKPEWSEILEGNPGIDEIVILPTSTRRLLQTRSEEHTSELRHLVISYAVFCLKKKKNQNTNYTWATQTIR